MFVSHLTIAMVRKAFIRIIGFQDKKEKRNHMIDGLLLYQNTKEFWQAKNGWLFSNN